MTRTKPGANHENRQIRIGRCKTGAADKSAIDRRSQLEQGARRINRVARQKMRDQDFVWHVLFVPQQKEFIAQKIITQWVVNNGQRLDQSPAGYVYLPLNARWRRESRYTRKKKRFAYPVIPGCLFFGTRNDASCWFALLRLHIVSGMMRVDDRLVTVSGQDLARFVNFNRKEIEGRRKHHETDDAKPLVCGDQAHVVDGPFEGYRVDIKAINGSSAQVLLNILGGIQEVEIAMDRLGSGP